MYRLNTQCPCCGRNQDDNNQFVDVEELSNGYSQCRFSDCLEPLITIVDPEERVTATLHSDPPGFDVKEIENGFYKMV